MQDFTAAITSEVGVFEPEGAQLRSLAARACQRIVRPVTALPMTRR
jgi:hypothetical protein